LGLGCTVLFATFLSVSLKERVQLHGYNQVYGWRALIGFLFYFTFISFLLYIYIFLSFVPRGRQFVDLSLHMFARLVSMASRPLPLCRGVFDSFFVAHTTRFSACK